MADPKDGNSNWLVSALALAVLALALLWFFSGDDEVSSSPDLGAQLTREVPRAQPAGNPVELDEKAGSVADGGQTVVAVVEESVGTPAAQTASGRFENGLPSGEAGIAGQAARTDQAGQSEPAGSSYGVVDEPEPNAVELQHLLRDAGPVPSDSELQRLSEGEAFREPTQDEIDQMRAEMARVQEPSPDEMARMRREAAIEPTEEQMERLRLQAEQLERSMAR